MGYSSIPFGRANDDLNAIIEIPAFSDPIKYEVDKDTDCIWVDRFVATSMFYPVNYGYVPQTLSDDGDPLDILVMTPFKLQAGVVIRCRPVGILYMEDESGMDYKVLAVPHNKISKQHEHIQDIGDVDDLLKKQLIHYFEHYKDLESGKWVKVKGWDNKAAAIDEITKSVSTFRK